MLTLRLIYVPTNQNVSCDRIKCPIITWWVTTVYSHHVKYPTVTWRSKQKIKDNKIQRPWHLGATSLFIDRKFVNQHKMLLELLTQPITLYNIDGSLNEAGSITHKVWLLLKVGQDEEKFDFFVTSLGPEKVILGLPWLRHRNPSIDWQKGMMKLSATSGTSPEPIEVEVTKIAANRMERWRLLAEKISDTSQDEVYCLASFTYSQINSREGHHRQRKENLWRNGTSTIQRFHQSLFRRRVSTPSRSSAVGSRYWSRTRCSQALEDQVVSYVSGRAGGAR